MADPASSKSKSKPFDTDCDYEHGHHCVEHENKKVTAFSQGLIHNRLFRIAMRRQQG